MAVILPIKNPENVKYTSLNGPFEGDEIFLDCRNLPKSSLPNLAEQLSKEPLAERIYLCLDTKKVSSPKPKAKKSSDPFKVFYNNIDVGAHPSFSFMTVGSVIDAAESESPRQIKKKEDLRSVLYSILNEHGLTDSDCFRSSNLDRRAFAKIRKAGYNPSKQTLLAIIIGCRFTLEEANRLLEQGGYAFSPSIELDIYLKERVIKQDYISIHSVNIDLYNKGFSIVLGSESRKDKPDNTD